MLKKMMVQRNNNDTKNTQDKEKKSNYTENVQKYKKKKAVDQNEEFVEGDDFEEVKPEPIEKKQPLVKTGSIKQNDDNWIQKTIQENIEEIKKRDEDMIYDTRVSNSLFSQMMTADFCSVFFGMLGLLLCICMHERKIIFGTER